MAGALPEQRVPWPAAAQSWRHVTFLHRPPPADVVAARLPARLEPDLWEGQALFTAAGQSAPSRPPLVGYSTGVDARLGPVRPLHHLNR